MEDQVVDEKKRKRLENQKRYRQKNREKLKEKNKQYRLDNKEKVAQTKKRWEEQNPQSVKDISKRYKERNLERVRLRQKLAYHANKDRHKGNALKRKYGMTLDDYEKMLQDQNGSCAICLVKVEDTKKKYLCVDHNHLTGEVRSLLCDPCNSAIGFFKEDQEVILRAADYLKKFSATLTVFEERLSREGEGRNPSSFPKTRQGRERRNFQESPCRFSKTR